MRDGADNVVIVCSIENVDPMGVHTGDSVTVAPQQTLTDRLYQRLRDQAIAVIRAVGVETGGSNVQFAVNPATEEIVVIEMNPRVSRSSALASKATGFPIAKIAARLAVGYRLDEIPNDITRLHAGELRADHRLRGRQVAAVRVREVPRRRRGALDPHEVGRRGDGDRAHVPAGVREGDALARARHRRHTPTATCWRASRRPGADRFDLMLEAFRQGATEDEVHARTDDRPAGSCASCTSWRCDPEAPFARRPHVQGGRHLRRRVRRRDALLLLGLGARGGRRGPPRRQAERDDPRLRPEPDRAGDRVRLLLRARGDDRARVRPRRGDGQLQPGDGVDRLRHLRPPVLRAADARGRARDRRGRAARGRDRAVRRPDAAAARGRAGGGGRAAARHPAGGDRPGRGPRALRRAARAARAEGAGLRDRALRGGGAGGRAARRLPAARAPELRARRPGDGDRLLARRARGLPAARRARLARARDLPRPLPGERGRGRRRRDLRRRGRVDRRRHAARRGGRDPLRRLGLRAPAALARARDARRDRRVDAAARARARRASG